MKNDEYNQEFRPWSTEEQEVERIAAEEGRKIQWLTVDDIGRKLFISHAQVYRYCRKRKLPFHKVGNRLLFLEPEVANPEVMRRIWHLIGRPERIATSNSAPGTEGFPPLVKKS